MSDVSPNAAQGAAVLGAVWRSMRPRQWTKNLIVFAPILFAGLLWRYDLLLVEAAAFAVLCALSGCAYILNDLADVVEDQRHPAKRERPIPSGRLRMRHALIACALLLVPTPPARVSCHRKRTLTSLNSSGERRAVFTAS